MLREITALLKKDILLEWRMRYAIGGILLYVASGMVKKKEVKEVMGMHKFHIALMGYTAVMVPVSGFMTAVVSAIVIYVIAYRWLQRKSNTSVVEEHREMAA